MSHHIDLAEARRRIVPVVEHPDRNFTPCRRIKADPPALTPGRGNFGLDQRALLALLTRSTSARLACSSLSRAPP